MALGTECANATPTATFSHGIPGITSPLTYDTTSCFKAVLYDVTSYDGNLGSLGSGLGNPEPTLTTNVIWGQPLPTDSASCISAWMGSDLFKKVGTSWVYVRSQSVNGTFSTSCTMSPIQWTAADMPANAGTFRVSASARTSNASSAATRRVTVATYANNAPDQCLGLALDDGKSCSTDGCDPSNGAISHRSFSQQCGGPQCVTATSAGTPFCNATNDCVVSTVQNCGLFICNPTPGALGPPGCLSNCAGGSGPPSDNFCSAGAFCDSTAPGVLCKTHLILGQACLRARQCDDANACNGSETCTSGVCAAGTPIVVTDNNPCTSDLCNMATGVVTHPNLGSGTSCADTNLCNGTETCNGSGTCLPGTPLVIVDDGNPCTSDGCNPQTGLTHTALNGASCDDGTVCNGHESCVQTVCTAGAALNVNDANACTVDSCDPIFGAVHVAIVTDDGNPCTTDTCNTSTGAVTHPARANGLSCGTPCQNQICQSGVCVAGTPAVIDDGVACTLDTCTDAAGVDHHSCSAIDRTVSSVMSNVDGFLFQGTDPVQTGVTATSVDPKVFAVIRGHVYDKAAVPISGVAITVVGHPEFGSTVSQGHGAYDLVVNGGQTLRLRFALPPYLPAERTVQVPVQDYVTASDVALLTPDTASTSVDLSGSPTDIQVARATAISDSSGARRATLFVPPGTLAAMVLPNNSTQSLPVMHFRATEYSVGTTGPNAAPATLPPGTAYGYTVELSTDEALAAGATEVDFSKALPLYVEDYLNIPAGTAIPHGFYSSSLGSWVPAANGVVLQIVSISGGAANLDITGDNIAESSTTLATTIGITDLERMHLGSLYLTGQKLWRIPVTHFSGQDMSWPDGPAAPNECAPHQCHVPNGTTAAPCEAGMVIHPCHGSDGLPGDCSAEPTNYCQSIGVGPFNYNGGCVGTACFIDCCPTGYNPNIQTNSCDADSSIGGGVDQPDTCDDPTPPSPPVGDGPGDCEHPNASTIRCQRESLGEDIPIAGTPYSLHYESDRQRGRKAELNIPLTSALPRPGLSGVVLQVSVAGQLFAATFSQAANQSTVYTWDGTDAYGRVLQGAQPVTVTVTSSFTGVYQKVDAFGLTGNGGAISSSLPTRQPFTVANTWHGTIGTWDALPQGLGGWSLNINHVYDVTGRVLRLGDGSNRTLTHIPPVIQTMAGNGSSTGASGDGGAATAATVRTPTSVAVGGDGSVYISDGQSCVRKVSPAGVIGPFAGQCSSAGFSGDNGPAASAQLRGPLGIAVASDGSVYIADSLNQRVRRVTTSGVIQTIAGSGPTGSGTGTFSGDGGSALQATFKNPAGVDVGANGVLYIADTGNGRIRSVSPDGTVRTIAGNGGTTTSGNEGLATAASLASPSQVRVGADGSLFIAEPSSQVVRRIGHDGVIHGFAGFSGGTVAGYAGDGGQAKAAQLRSPSDISIGADGTVFIVDQNNTVRSVSPSGVIGTYAGTAGKTGFTGDTGPAAAATFSASQGIAVAADGTVYLACTADNRVRRISPALASFSGNSNVFQFASADGRTLDSFDGRGRHLATTDALTSAALAQFGYDANGRLITVTDVDNNVTHINHDSSGNPTNIVGPFGQTTTFGVDTHGYLTTVTDPATKVTTFTYDAKGMMATKVDANHGLSQYGYDAVGHLQLDQDPAGGSIAMSRVNSPAGFTVSMSSALGLSTTYQTKSTPDGAFSRQNTGPDALSSALQFSPNGVTKTTAPDGTITTSTPIPDPQFGMLAPTLSVTTTLPSANAQTRTMTRSIARTGSNITTVAETTSLNGNSWLRMFDVPTRTWSSTSPLGRLTTTVVDLAGRPISVTVPGITKRTMTLDLQGRLKAIDQGVRDEAFTYFATVDATNGYLQKVTDPLLQATSYTRDAFGRELSETAPDNTLTGFSWDPLANLTSETPPGRPAHNMSYSLVNLMSTYAPPVLASVPTTQTSYDYDVDRKLKTVTRPDGAQLLYAYDTAGRLQTVTTPTGTVTRTYNLQHVATLAASADNVSIAFTFDGPLLTRSDYSGSVAGAVIRQYNADFRPFRELVSGTGTADGFFGYDADGLITCVSPSTCSPAGADAFTLVHDPDNGLLKTTALGTVAHSLSYNTFGELATETAVSGSTALYSDTYDNSINPRDNLGRVLRKTETVQGATTVSDYTYWPAGQLKTASRTGSPTASYAYDANGNRLSVTASGVTTSATYDAQDRLLTYGTFTYTYTANGELKTKTNSVGNALTQYQYDVFGNLKRVDLPNGDFIEYLVDGQNRRVVKKKNGTPVKKWLYRDQLHPVEELDGAGNFLSRFMYAAGKDSPDYMVKSGVEYRILSDQLGSPRLVVNASTGVLAQRMREDEFGVVLEDTSPGFTPFGFAGGLYDTDTGLVRFGARDYDPMVGRWISKDPILFDGGQTNLYVYVGNDPINGSDATGLLKEDPECITKVRTECENGCRNTCGGALDQACFDLCFNISKSFCYVKEDKDCQAWAAKVYGWCIEDGHSDATCAAVAAAAYADCKKTGRGK